jgi:4'-phosphopantetheinyl transferase
MSTPLKVQWAGGAVAASVDGVGIVGVRGRAEREVERATARLAIRAVLRDALATHFGVASDRVELHTPSGSAPWAVVALDAAPRRVALAISHAGELSVAAFAEAGVVGIDVSRIVPVPDWEAVARDYLGPAAAQALATAPAGQRDAAFAHAWSEHEARLKCLGLQLDEWDAARAPALRACACLPLALPAGYAGYLALSPTAA